MSDPLSDGTTADAPIRVLVAEDDPEMLDLVRRVLSEEGYAVSCARDGHQAMLELDAGAFDLLLTDIRMPGPRGNEIAQRIRTMPRLQDMPIVLMTAFVLSEVERKDMISNCGVDLIINKPRPEPMELHAILHGIIDKKLSG